MEFKISWAFEKGWNLSKNHQFTLFFLIILKSLRFKNLVVKIAEYFLHYFRCMKQTEKLMTCKAKLTRQGEKNSGIIKWTKLFFEFGLSSDWAEPNLSISPPEREEKSADKSGLLHWIIPCPWCGGSHGHVFPVEWILLDLEWFFFLKSASKIMAMCVRVVVRFVQFWNGNGGAEGGGGCFVWGTWRTYRPMPSPYLTVPKRIVPARA